ncbi:hypothetical protein PAESOLCIP111_03100 [Paenibacillus solanacearum]|uniref:Uncharacterized protein n=1 Tax=Paenibacillus solanacearum TaxID=2048548 RepID=A0A916K1X6_9BACL|nr:hypothetical protein PAESOLCIP111_03100 [Paenibacillus solanacearum]
MELKDAIPTREVKTHPKVYAPKVGFCPFD